MAADSTMTELITAPTWITLSSNTNTADNFVLTFDNYDLTPPSNSFTDY